MFKPTFLRTLLIATPLILMQNTAHSDVRTKEVGCKKSKCDDAWMAHLKLCQKKMPDKKAYGDCHDKGSAKWRSCRRVCK